MKLLHISDLHIGKRVNAFSMIEDQVYILNQIVSIVRDIAPRAILISGDIYDKTTPGDEAVRVLDGFLTELIRMGQDIYIISGNHDSSVKLAFAADMLDRVNLHISHEYDGTVARYEIEEDGVKADIFLLPFIKPAYVRTVDADADVKTYSEAIEYIIKKINPDTEKINIILSHQFVTGAVRSESEDISVGGLDGVDADVYDVFDYVALGHLHRPQKVGRETMRYSGTPLKYSMSEADHDKSLTVVDIRGKDDISVDEIPLKPLRDMRIIKGKYSELMDKKYYDGTATEDYLHVILGDEDEVPDAIARLRVVYPNIMSVAYDNKRTSRNNTIDMDEKIDTKTPIEIWQEFYELQNNRPMSDEQKKISEKYIEEIWNN